MKLKTSHLGWWITGLTAALFFITPALAQDDQTLEGKDWGDYHVNQSIEVGWRGTSFTGNNDVYDTFVNLGQGARLFNQTLEMRSKDHQGLLFDTLSLTNFGYGGDPNNFSMLRISKNKWYDFSANFRRDRNLWNYDLLANPLNPTTSNPSVIIQSSPHSMALTRRMGDYNLTLLPQSNIRVRLGYSRNTNEGPSLTTYHVGTEALLFQEFKATTNNYQVGIDFKVLPRTNFSYDQYLNYYKGDSTWTDNNLIYALPNGQLVDMGVSWDTKNNSPCAKPIVNPTTTPITVSPKCSDFSYYSRTGPVRTASPTEQLSFQSNYFKNVDMAGRVVYSSSGSSIADFNELFQGYESRTLARQLTTSGPVAINRTAVSADYDVTFTITPKFRIVDEFRFAYFRIPGQNDLTTSALFGSSATATLVGFDPATCPPPYTAKACPVHNASSEADLATSISSIFLGQDTKANTFQLEYDFNSHLGGRIGHRYRHRIIDQRNVAYGTSTYDPTLAKGGPCAGAPLNPDGSCTVSGPSTQTLANFDASTTINENSLLLGLWARPTDKVRLSYDQEWMYADNTFTRVSPRQFQHYKFRSDYKPKQWLNMGTTFNIYEARNNVYQVDHLEHTRNYGAYFNVAPTDRWSLDGGYNYTSIFSQTNICFIFGSGAPPAVFPACTIVGSPVTLQGLSIYNNKMNYGYFDFMVKPTKRVTLRVGYSIDDVTGNTLILNPNSPTGPLDYKYHRPFGTLDIALARGVTWRTSWGYYDYNEMDASTDPTGPRSFRGNLVNLSLVYSF
ncbi:MAG TPA: hypothetical protein VG028_20425 [Terriglobia bacterium]|nr:hypothetical protein [Terriglobia bacterium]